MELQQFQDFVQTVRPLDRKSTRLNSSHTVIYTLSLHDALPISLTAIVSPVINSNVAVVPINNGATAVSGFCPNGKTFRSEEHTSELQSHSDLHSFPTRRSSDLTDSNSFSSYKFKRCCCSYKQWSYSSFRILSKR